MKKDLVQGIMAHELEKRAEDLPDFEIITFENGSYANEVITYSDIAIKGRKIINALRNAGIGKGDMFSVVMRNHPEIVYSLYAATAIGAIIVFIDPRSKGSKLAYQLADSKSKGVIITRNFLENFEEVRPQIPGLKHVWVLDKQGFEGPDNKKYYSLNEILDGPELPWLDKPNNDPESPVEILYTSGTTGDPKGVVIKTPRVNGMVNLAKNVWQYKPEDKLYTGLSLTHGNAQGITMNPSLLLGIPSVISQKFTKSRLWDICREHGCTSFSLLGGMMMGLHSEPVKFNDSDNPVRLVISAGTPKAIWETFETRFDLKIHEWYSAMEGGFAHNAPGTGPVGSFGKPLEETMEMRIVREDDTLCDPWETGEIIFRVKGERPEVVYWGKPAASEKKTRGGWLRTGDMGHTDENGWFNFDYRKGGGLRRAGDFIIPEYVEAKIATHPQVNDVCVYGVPAASGAPGESDLVAAVVPFEGEQIEIKTVFDLCQKMLEGNSIPSYLQILEEIPKTSSEKNLARILADKFNPEDEGIFSQEKYR